MAADLHWIVGVMRIGPPGYAHGQPYQIAVAVVAAGDGLVEIQGLDRPITRDQWRAMARCLADAGFERYRFERRSRDGQISRWREGDLKRWL